MARNSEKTKQKLLQAAKKLLAEQGFQNIGINNIAREAGVDKVLIYRYFGGLPELLRELARSSEFWPYLEETVGSSLTDIQKRDIKELSSHFLKNRLRELRKRPFTQEILRWELIERNQLTDQFHFERENQGHELNRLIPFNTDRIAGIDIAAASALMLSGVTYLVLRSKTADSFNGIDLHSEDGWKRIEDTIDVMIEIFFDHIAKQTDTGE